MTQRLRGYVSHRPFGGFQIPAHVQNLVLRDYAARIDHGFMLSVGEYAFDDCYLQLYGLVPSLKAGETLAMCSLFILPSDSNDRRNIMEMIINTGVELHFVFENLVVKNINDCSTIDDLYKLRKALLDCPQDIPKTWPDEIQGVNHFY